MHERHEGMEAIGKAMQGTPSPARFRESRHQRHSCPDVGDGLGRGKNPGWFPAGTGPDVGKTRAKPEIWTQHDLFLRKAKDYAAAAQAVDAAAKAGDLNEINGSPRDLDKACKACHQPFRAPSMERWPWRQSSRSGTCRSGSSTGCWPP